MRTRAGASAPLTDVDELSAKPTPATVNKIIFPIAVLITVLFPSISTECPAPFVLPVTAQRGKAATKEEKRICRKERKGRKGKTIPNLASWRELILIFKGYGLPENLRKPRKLSTGALE
jgi:hypothetical protein